MKSRLGNISISIEGGSSRPNRSAGMYEKEKAYEYTPEATEDSRYMSTLGASDELSRFVNPETGPDLLWIVKREGLYFTIKGFPMDLQSNIRDAFLNNSYTLAVEKIAEYASADPSAVADHVFKNGVIITTKMVQGYKNLNDLIFEDPSQEENKAVDLVSVELIKNEPEIVERSTIQCKCGSRRVRIAVVQMRRADEPPEILAHCITCNNRWSRHAA
mgnify:CR=1 FL=1